MAAVPSPRILMVDPGHFEVAYIINPWMQPDAWRRAPHRNRQTARRGWTALRAALGEAGAQIETVPGIAGLADMVFAANAAIVLDRRALLARFRCAERQPEEAAFRAAFLALQARGLLDEVGELPERLIQEGAGDCVWDAARRHFWAGYGPRSDAPAAAYVAGWFGQQVVKLELVSQRFYHLDVCFCPLAGGEVLFYPGAFSAASLALIHDRVPAALRLEASEAEARLLCLNAINLGRSVVMARTAPRLRAVLTERGYRCVELDLAPFILSGGAAFCMTLRLDRCSGVAAPQSAAALVEA